jgi:hypothetical protein
MDEQQSNKAIGYVIVIIIGYHIIGMFIPILIWGLIGLVGWRIINEYYKHKK